MKRILPFLAMLLVCLSISACQRQDVGMVGGAAVGGLLGSAITDGSTAGTIVGAVGGGYVGRQLAR